MYISRLDVYILQYSDRSYVICQYVKKKWQRKKTKHFNHRQLPGTNLQIDTVQFLNISFHLTDSSVDHSRLWRESDVSGVRVQEQHRVRVAVVLQDGVVGVRAVEVAVGRGGAVASEDAYGRYRWSVKWQFNRS